MNIVYLLVPASLCLAACFISAFIWVIRAGQYDDTDTPAYRVIMDDPEPSKE